MSFCLVSELVKSLIFVYDNLESVKGEHLLHALERATHCCYQHAPRNSLPTAPLQPLPTFLRRIAVDAEGKRQNTFLPLADDWLKLMLTFIYTVSRETGKLFPLTSGRLAQTQAHTYLYIELGNDYI